MGARQSMATSRWTRLPQTLRLLPLQSSKRCRCFGSFSGGALPDGAQRSTAHVAKPGLDDQVWLFCAASAAGAMALSFLDSRRPAGCYYEKSPSGEVDRLRRWSRVFWNLPSGISPNFHETEVNPHLEKHIPRWTAGMPSPDAADKASVPRVLVPLCGKSVDMPYLCELGYGVVGVEGVQRGILEFKAEHQVRVKGMKSPVVVSKDDQGPGWHEGAAFVPAKKFQGARRNYVFKTGAQGLGYYSERPAVWRGKVNLGRRRAPLHIIEGDMLDVTPEVVAASTFNTDGRKEILTFDLCCRGAESVMLRADGKEERLESLGGHPQCFTGHPRHLSFDDCCSWPRLLRPTLQLAAALLRENPPLEAPRLDGADCPDSLNWVELGAAAAGLEAERSSESVKAGALLVASSPASADDLVVVRKCTCLAQLALLRRSSGLASMLDTDQLAARPFLLQAVHQALLGFRLLASFAQYRGFSEKTCAHQMAALQAIRSDLLKVEGVFDVAPPMGMDHSLRLRRIHDSKGFAADPSPAGSEVVRQLWEAEGRAMSAAYLTSASAPMLQLWEALDRLLHGRRSKPAFQLPHAEPQQTQHTSCQQARQHYFEAKTGSFLAAAAAYEELQRCSEIEVPMIFWQNQACMTGNHLLSLASTVLLAMLLGRGFRFRASDFPGGVSCDRVLTGPLCSWSLEPSTFDAMAQPPAVTYSYASFQECLPFLQRLYGFTALSKAGEMDLPHLVVKDQCQYFVPSLFRNPRMRPLLERWFWQAGSRWKVFSPLGRWLFGDLASHLEHRVTSFVQVHKLYPGASNRFRACAQNRFVEAADWWARCIRELSAGASTQVFIATIEHSFLTEMARGFGRANLTYATATWARRPDDIPHVFSSFIDMWLLGRACDVAVTTSHSTFGYVGPALFGVPRISGPGTAGAAYGGRQRPGKWWQRMPACSFHGAEEALRKKSPQVFSFEPCSHFLQMDWPHWNRSKCAQADFPPGLLQIPSELLPRSC
ncbi:unnamed protein product [Effrenium voratum]|uniref:Uncharacterized protein n=1 Tax=Effrenium voratum TaxID=2562239 RepID=A0AA36J709_9DINO|nr:unnamed protein product [Effrenium voratum]